MKLLFIVQDLCSPRYGVMSLSSFVKKHKHLVQISSCLDFKKLLEDINSFKPDVVAYSCTSGEYPVYKIVNEKIKKKYPNIFSIFGGPHPTYSPEIIKDQGVDGICIGEGEEALLEFCDKWDIKKREYKIKNWYFKKGKKIIKNGLRPLMNLDKLEIPDFELFPVTNEFFMILLSRGCFFNCKYCFNHQWKTAYKNDPQCNKVRVMSVENVMKCLRQIKSKLLGKFRYLWFDDDIFPLDKEWVKKFSKMYKEEINIPFQINLQPTLIEEGNIKMLRYAGLYKVTMAIESGSEEIREKVLGRYMSNAKILESARIIKKYGIKLSLLNMTCLPLENITLAKKTFELNIQCKPDIATVSKFVPYPKARLTEFAIEKGYLKRHEFEKNIPGDFHWISLLHFPKNAKKYQMENLLHFFSLGVKYPFLKNIIYCLITLKRGKKVVKLFSYIDTQTWITVTHQDFDILRKKGFLKEVRLSLRLIKKLITG